MIDDNGPKKLNFWKNFFNHTNCTEEPFSYDLK